MLGRKRSPSPGDGSFEPEETALPTRSPRTSRLHHRRQNQTSNGQRGRQTVAEKYRRRRQRRFSNVGDRIRMVLAVGIPIWLTVLIIWQWPSLHFSDKRRNFAQVTLAAKEKRGQRVQADALVWSQIQEHGSAKSDRAIARRQRSQPLEFQEEELYSYEIWGLDRQERKTPGRDGGVPVASAEELCGYLAQGAFAENQASYTRPLDKNSKVIITGAISSTVGSHIWGVLRDTCGVQMIFGVDSLFPNTISHRLDLTTDGGSMQQWAQQRETAKAAVQLGHVGLDPIKLPKKISPVLSQTSELDYCGNFDPTHIVHVPFLADASPLYNIRSSMLSIEQILTSMAQAKKWVPQLVIASSNHMVHELPMTTQEDVLESRLRLIDEVMADFYQAEYDVQSTLIRLPRAVYGPDTANVIAPWINETVYGVEANFTAIDEDAALDLVHVDDVVDAFVASMQRQAVDGRNSVVDITSGGTVVGTEVRELIERIMTGSSSPMPMFTEHAMEHPSKDVTRREIGWDMPSVSLHEGLARVIGWTIDRKNPYGTVDERTGDQLLKLHNVTACEAGDRSCHRQRPFLACASECSTKTHCILTMYDDMVDLVREVTEGCDIVLYTQDLGRNIRDLKLHSEYMEEGEPSICNIAFVSNESPLVTSAVQKVPASELERLGIVALQKGNESEVEAFRKDKLTRLNGRLLFRGWILVWPEETPAIISERDASLVKIAPGKLLHDDVKHAFYLDQSFSASPSIKDIHFLVSEMHREAWRARLVKRKTRPKAKFVLPAEPERKAVLFMPELKFQESPDAERLPSDTKVNVYEASRFMRFENGEHPLGKENSFVKAQREYYEKMASYLNRDLLRPPDEPAHKWEWNLWARTRWVLHDMKEESARLVRCDWYQEHVSWGADLDQLSLAFVLSKKDLRRRVAFQEPDEVVQKALEEKTNMKKLLSDTFEWTAIQAEQNRLYSPFEEMSILPYEIDFVVDEPEEDADSEPQLFVRIISDRLMSMARKTWNDDRELAEIEKIILEQEKEAGESGAADTSREKGDTEIERKQPSEIRTQQDEQGEDDEGETPPKDRDGSDRDQESSEGQVDANEARKAGNKDTSVTEKTTQGESDKKLEEEESE